jgi:peptide/nickel transport system permease protein
LGANPVAGLIVRRVALALATLLAVSVVIFALVQALPSDAAEALLGQNATPQAVAHLRQELGLNEPVIERYFSWLARLLGGDLGRSLANGLPVAELLRERLGNTLFLFFVSASGSLPLALVLGLACATWRGSLFDRACNIVAASLISSPQFLVAYLLIYFLSVTWGLFPSSADIRPGMAIHEKLYVAFLPALTLSVIVVAYMLRMTRAAILDVLENDFIRMAILKGMKQRRVVVHHALPNAIAPIAIVVALLLAYLIVGVVIVETVFVYPGLGQLLVDAVGKRDIVVVQAVSMIFAAAFITFNTAADIVSIICNPRLLYPRS